MAKFNWDTVYTDLSPRSANALREARIKPDQLVKMSDGEITSIEGIGDVGLEEIRAKYPAGLTEEEIKDPEAKEVKTPTEEVTARPRNKIHAFRRSSKMKSAKMQVDRTKFYDVDEAAELVKKTNVARFNATVTLHLNLKEKLSRVEVTFPHSTGVTKKVAIVTDELLKEIEKGDLNFDILVATPAMMPKLTKYARVLGPKGLMPNPKTGTITDNPEAKKKELEGGRTIVAGESKYPLMHAVVGKVEQPAEELAANVQALIEAVKTKNVLKATLAATMSPGVKIRVQ